MPLILLLTVSVPTSADQLLLPRGWLLRAMAASATQDLVGAVPWPRVSNMKQAFASFYHDTAMFVFLRWVSFGAKPEPAGAANP